MGAQGGTSPVESYPDTAELSATLKDRVLERIRKGDDFPATSATINLITRLTTANETSVSELANIILTDLGLTTKILKLLNSVFYMRFGEVRTISRAIILLGLENLRNIALSLTLFDKLQKKNSRLLINLMAKAVYAGILGRKVADKVGYPNTEEGFICSLFRNLGEILIAYYSPEDINETEGKSSENNREDRRTNERAVLGATYQEIGIIIAGEWSLPNMIVHCMKRVYNEEILANPSQLDKLHYISAISSQIADIMETTRDGKKLHIKNLIESFGKQFEKLNGAIETIIPDANKDAIKYCDAYGLDFQKSTLGVSLTGHSPKPSALERESVSLAYDLDAQAARRDGSAEGSNALNPETVFADGMKDITNAILDNYSLNDIFRIVIETMFRGMKFSGIEKTLLFIKDTKQPVMNLRLSLGDSMESLSSWFTIPTDNSGDIFNIAIERQRALFIGDTSKEDVQPLIPQWFRERMHHPLLLILLPIMVKGRPIGLVYLEGDPQYADSISSTHLNYLRALHNQIMLAIKQNH
jgi:eukaryotic-like serine/threonine-protein kinase